MPCFNVVKKNRLFCIQNKRYLGTKCGVEIRIQKMYVYVKLNT